jgi:REP element-mobilizing transposase RayT
MSRPLRIEFAGAIYHVTSRGDRREDIVIDDTDRLLLLAVLGQAMERFDAQALSYCLMSNHYHFVLHTRQANLSRLMRHVNGVYTQAFNRRHDQGGHLFQGRFKAILVDRESYLLEVCRYVELNPVRAGLVARAGDWAWSSYRAHIGVTPSPEWLDTAGLHGYVLGREPRGAADQRRAAARYEALVEAGRDVSLWDAGLRTTALPGRRRLRFAHARVSGALPHEHCRGSEGAASTSALDAAAVAGRVPHARTGDLARLPGFRPVYDRDCCRAGAIGVACQQADLQRGSQSGSGKRQDLTPGLLALQA